MELVRVFYMSMVAKEPWSPTLLEGLLARLPAPMRQSITQLKRWEDRQRSLAGKLLLDRALGLLGRPSSLDDVVLTPFNKPVINGELYFNISHSGNYVVCCATKNHPVGIDVELMVALNIHEFRSQMTDSEWRRVEGSEDPRREFYKYWTDKEAVIKANGKGLSIPLKEFEIIDGQTVIENCVWFVSTVDLDERYSCSIASARNNIHTELICCDDLFEP